MIGYKRLVHHVLAVIAKHSPKFLTCFALAKKLRERHILVKASRLVLVMHHLMDKECVIRKLTVLTVKPHSRSGVLLTFQAPSYTLSPGAWMIEQTKNR